MWKTWDLMQKSMLILLAGLIVLFGILTAVFQSRPGISFQDGLLPRIENGEGRTYRGTVDGRKAEVSVLPGDGVCTVEVWVEGVAHDLCRVEYPLPEVETIQGPCSGIRIWRGDTLLFEGACDPEGEFLDVPCCLYDMEGQIAASALIIDAGTITVGGYDPWDWYETGLSTILRFAFGTDETARGSWLFYGVMVMATLFLMVDVAFPLALFHLRYMFSVRDPEPTDFYLAMQRLGWVVGAVAIVAGYCMALFFIE